MCDLQTDFKKWQFIYSIIKLRIVVYIKWTFSAQTSSAVDCRETHVWQANFILISNTILLLAYTPF